MPASGDVMNSFFTITNGGQTGIGHLDYCGIHMIVGESGHFARSQSIVGFPYGRQLGPSGGAQSTQCLQIYSDFVGTVACADVEFWVDYSLDTQPAIRRKKFFRFVGYRTQGQFTFVPEPPAGEHSNVVDDRSYCGKYLAN